jgi:anaphase-promoting complex subunit 2
MLQGVGSRFDFHMNKTLCDLRCVICDCFRMYFQPLFLRTREIFDIIIDFPDSMGALQDLRVCLIFTPLLFASLTAKTQDCMQRVDQRAALVQSLRKA